MGYRSDVRILVTTEGLKVLQQKTVEYAKEYCKLNSDKEWAKAYCEHSILEDWKVIDTNYSDEIILETNYIKWDTYYADVQWIYNALQDLTEMHLPYQVINIGEDGAYEDAKNYEEYDDIEPLKTEMFVEINFNFQ